MILELKTNVKGLVKTNAGIVLNTNKDQYTLVKTSKAKSKEMKQMRAELSQLRKDVEGLKEIVRKHVSTT